MEAQFFGSCVFCAPLDRHIGRYVGHHIDWCSGDMSVNIWSTYRPTIGRYLGRYSGRHSEDTLTDIYWRNIGQPLLVYRLTLLKIYICQKLRLSLSGYTHFILFQRPGKKTNLKTWYLKFNFPHRSQAKVKSPPLGRLCKSNSPLPGHGQIGGDVSCALVSSHNSADLAQLNFNWILTRFCAIDHAGFRQRSLWETEARSGTSVLLSRSH